MTDLLRSDFHYHFQSILELLWKKKSEEQEHFVKAVSQKLLVLVVGSFNCIGINLHFQSYYEILLQQKYLKMKPDEEAKVVFSP